VSRNWQKCDENAPGNCRHDGLAPNSPQFLVMQKMLERRNQSILDELVTFERKLPKKAPWHLRLHPIR
jgi:hypothetical protein